jgi:fermentation-respiration switch protein FrsA (DUF1100 family)
MRVIKKASRILALLGFVLVLIYATIVGAVFFKQRSMQYHPSPTFRSLASYGADEFREVFFDTTDGLRLKSWYAAAKNGRATIVVFHGNGSHVGDRLQYDRPYAKAGLGVLLVEYRGYSGNPGQPTEDGLFEDARAALAFLARQGVPPENIVLAGHSLGTGVAVRMAAENTVAGLILDAPFSSALDIAQALYPFLPVSLTMLDQYRSDDYIARIAAPLLIFHGDRDGVIPLNFGQRLFEQAVEPKEMHIVRGAGHSLGNNFGTMKVKLSFIARVTNK